MSFDEMWAEIWLSPKLPYAAKQLIPHELSTATKKSLARCGTDKAVRLLQEALSEIEAGSEEKLDSIISRKLK